MWRNKSSWGKCTFLCMFFCTFYLENENFRSDKGQYWSIYMDGSLVIAHLFLINISIRFHFFIYIPKGKKGRIANISVIPQNPSTAPSYIAVASPPILRSSTNRRNWTKFSLMTMELCTATTQAISNLPNHHKLLITTNITSKPSLPLRQTSLSRNSIRLHSRTFSIP